MFNKNKNNKGFTLVELLVVIAIIGILAVVAVPALFKNIEKAKIAELEADISAIKSAALSYYSDTSGNLPDIGGIKLIKEDGKIKLDTKSISNGNIEAVESFMKEVEGVSMPFGDLYWIEITGGTTGETSCYGIDLRVGNHNISDSGLEKLKNDIGEKRVETDDRIDKEDPTNTYRSLNISLIDKL